jgi:hypothetical protein
MSNLRISRFFIESHLPSTFEERGAAVAFTTPALAGARVRTDERHGLTVLVKNFSGTAAIYAIPISALFEVFATTVHDRALIETIQTETARSPSAIRRETLRVMSLGLAGPEGKAKGAEIIEADNQFRVYLEQVILISMLKAIDADVSSIVTGDFGDPHSIFGMKQHLHDLMTPLGMGPELIDERLLALSDAVSFIGFPNDDSEGRLRTLLREIDIFTSKMENRARATNAEFGKIFSLSVQTAEQTMSLARPLIGHIDYLLNDLVYLMNNWDSQFINILRNADRLSWLLDGWETVLAFAKDCDEWDNDSIWDNSEILVAMLPIIPRGEAFGDTEDEPDLILWGSRARVLALHNWKNGKIDHEMVRRIEEAKSRMKENGAIPRRPPPKRNPRRSDWELRFT